MRQKIDHQKRLVLISITSIILCISIVCFAEEVNFLRVRGTTIRIGFTTDHIFRILKKGDMVNETVEKDPNNPNSPLLVKNYRNKGRKFKLYFARVNDTEPYRITKIITE